MYLACTHICVFSICIFIFLAAISNLQILISYVRNEGCHILQIDTNDGTVEILDNVEHFLKQAFTTCPLTPVGS